MSKKIKEQELEKLQGLVQKLNSVITDLGVLETQKHTLLHAYSETVSYTHLTLPTNREV